MNCLTPRREFELARAELGMAAELDPVSPAIATSFGILRFFERDYAGAIAQLRSVLGMEAEFALAHLFLGQAYIETKQYGEAVRQLERTAALMARAPEAVAALGYAHAAAGRKAEARRALEELAAQSASRYVSPVLVAQLQAGLNEADAAAASLEDAFRRRSADLMWLPVAPAFDGIRSLPRVGELLGKMGLQNALAVPHVP
jgi:Flp pilus assembly protein TadD